MLLYLPFPTYNHILPMLYIILPIVEIFLRLSFCNNVKCNGVRKDTKQYYKLCVDSTILQLGDSDR